MDMDMRSSDQSTTSYIDNRTVIPNIPFSVEELSFGAEYGIIAEERNDEQHEIRGSDILYHFDKEILFDSKFSSLLSIKTGDHCFSACEKFTLDGINGLFCNSFLGLPNLRYFEIGKWSLMKCTELKLQSRNTAYK